MKKFLIILISIVLTHCSSNDSENNHNFLDSLEGIWEEVLPCQSCSTITISKDGTILLKFNNDPETYRMTFTLEGNSMQVVRHWNVGGNQISNQVLIKFNQDDTLELSQFFVTDATSTTGFDDAVFKKV